MIVLLEYMAAGFGMALALIFLAKVIMAKVLLRDNDYYKDEYDGGGEDDV